MMSVKKPALVHKQFDTRLLLANILQQTIPLPVIFIPAAAFATPARYTLNGKQYIVNACGGNKLKPTSGDRYIVCVLPGK